MSNHDSYLSARANLIAEERSLRCDAAHIQAASAEELQAEEIIRSVKIEEGKTIWSIEHDGVTNTFAGMEFLTCELFSSFLDYH